MSVYIYIYIYIYMRRGNAHIPGGQVAWATIFCPGAPNICGLPVWNLVHVTSPVLIILK